MKLALIFAEFGRPVPDLSQFHRYFPGAEVCAITEHLARKEDRFDGPRYNWRMNDYWKVRGALDSWADIAIAWDADMRIVSSDVAVLPLLANRFGLCLPANPRKLVRVDTLIGADSDQVLDETRGCGYAYNCTPIALNLHHAAAVACAEEYCRVLLEHPVRGPLAWWRAAWRMGFAPYVLPPQWCVCGDDIGLGNEIVLHEGHDAVQRHYAAHRAS